MDAAQTIDTQITLPIELYQAIAKLAQTNGQSVSGEIVSLLTPLLIEKANELDREFEAWEAASDEDWLNMEATLASNEIASINLSYNLS
jgi:hypothetical protein